MAMASANSETALALNSPSTSYIPAACSTANPSLNWLPIMASRGDQVNLNGGLRDIIVPRRYNCEYDVHYWGLEGPNAPLTYPIGWAILAKNVPYWHQKAYDEGPPWLREATKYVRLAMTTVDTAQLRTYMTRVRDLHTENVPIITIGSAYHVWGASSRLGNIPYQNVADNGLSGLEPAGISRADICEKMTHGAVPPCPPAIKKKTSENSPTG